MAGKGDVLASSDSHPCLHNRPGTGDLCCFILVFVPIAYALSPHLFCSGSESWMKARTKNDLTCEMINY